MCQLVKYLICLIQTILGKLYTYCILKLCVYICHTLKCKVGLLMKILFSTWSDREIRTLLTRMHELPLSLATVTAFETRVVNCSHRLPKHIYQDIVTPLYERYVDSKMVRIFILFHLLIYSIFHVTLIICFQYFIANS